MNDLRKAAEQALEALQDTCDYLPSRSGVEREVDDAITALRIALAHPEQKYVIDCPRCGHCCPERRWVGLTDEEGAEIWGDAHDIDRNRLVTPKEIVRRIEAKLKEKNG
jgi:hypothetical protein